ncbi:hypothetical protein [Actinorugispora endophytica]|nr:hypothetical protein [Actinorugispora endophytica]
MGHQRSRRAAIAAVMTLCVVTGCVQPSQEDGAGRPPAESSSSSPDGEPTAGPVEGDPDTPVQTPEATPEDPADLVAAIERAVLTRRTARYTATASLSGIRRAEATGGYAFHSEDSVDFTADLDMRSRDGDDYSARAVAVGDRFYLEPPTTEGMPDGTTWIGRSREDFEDPPEPRALYAETIRAISGIRDWSMIAGSTDLVPAGGRSVDGVRGRGYRATFTVLDGMQNVSGKGGAWRVLQDLYAQGVRDIDFTVWVDDEYLPLAAVVELEGDGRHGHIDLVFSDWGSTVDFPVPPSSEVWNRS